MPAVTRYHVVTWVETKNDGIVERRPLKQGEVVNPYKDEKNPGDDVKGVVSTVENYQADGSKACEGDKKLYPVAEERVIARLMADQRVLVTWRKYRPKVASGEARPGKPFVAENDGVRIRVEMREIVDDAAEVIDDAKVSPLGLRRLEAQIKNEEVMNGRRQRLRELAAEVGKLVESTPKAMREAAAALKASGIAVDVEADIEGMTGAARAFAKASLEARRTVELAEDAAKAVEAQGVELTKSMAAAGGDLASAVNAVRGAQGKVEAFRRVDRDYRKAHEAINAAGNVAPEMKTGWDQAVAAYDAASKAAVNSLQAAVDMFLAEARKDPAGIGKLAATLTQTEQRLRQQLDTAMQATRDAEPVNNEAEAQRRYGLVCRGRVHLRAVDDGKGGVARWEAWFINQGDTPFCGTVAFPQSGKNAGFGFESMACLNRGDVAMQPIHADRDYGLRPAPGTIVRLAVRGYGTFEVGLPAAGQAVDIPIRRMRIEGQANNGYFARNYVEPKRAEKSAKVQFFLAPENRKPWNTPFQFQAESPFPAA